MKLPSRVRTGVQSLGREDPSSIISAGRAIASGLDSIGQLAAQYKARQDEADDREARLAMSNSMAEFESRYGGKDYISAEDIPDGIDVRKTEKITSASGVVEEVARAQIPAYEVYPQLYKSFAQSNIESSASKIRDEKLRNKWIAENQISASQGFANRAIAANSAQEKFLAAQLDSNIESAVKGGDYTGAAILAEEIADENKRSSVMYGIERAKQIDYVDSLILGGAESDQDLVAVEREIERLRDESVSYNMSTAERKAKADALEAASSEHEMSLVERRKREEAQIVSDATVRIGSGDPTMDDNVVQQLFDDGLISGQMMASMKLSILNNRQQAIKAQAVKVDIDKFASSPYGIDPKNKDQRAAVNERYDSYVQASGDSKAAAIQIMQEFKVVPDAMMGRFRSANRADAIGLRETAELWVKAEDYAPQSLADLRDNEVDVVRRVAANIRLGMSAGDAVEQVRRYDSMTPDQRAALEQQSKSIGENNVAALAEMVNDQPSYKLDWGWVPFAKGAPDVPSFMAADFDAKVRKYMPQVGYQLPVAQRMAFTDITKQWQRTDVNGEWQLMKNAPQGPSDQIRSLIAQQYGSDDSIRITSDQLTQLQIDNGKPVSYQAFRIVDPDTQEIEILPRFQWDAKAAADARVEQITKESEIGRQKRRLELKRERSFAGIDR